MIKKIRTLNSLTRIVLQIIKAELIYFMFGQRALSNYIRKIDNPLYLLKYLGVQIGKDTNIWPGITLNCENRKKYKLLKIGKSVRILWDVIIDLNDEIDIGDYTHIGTRSILITHFNLGKSPLGKTEYPYIEGPIKIGKGSVISWGTTVLHDTEIGEHTIISSGSIINGKIPSFCVFGGNPGRPIKKITPQNPEDFK